MPSVAQLSLQLSFLCLVILNEAGGTDSYVIPMIDWLASVEGPPTQNELTATQIHTGICHNIYDQMSYN